MLKKKYFSYYREPFANLPNLVEMQTDSYKLFLKTGLREIFDEFSPMTDYTGEEFDLEFLDYELDEPKFDEDYVRINSISYEASLRIKVRLTNKKTKEKKEQEIFMADIPLMTTRGTFIINGVERVVVSQLMRSFGAYFNLSISRGRKRFGAKIIPSRGAWIEFDTESDGTIYARIDRKRKIPATALLRVFGLHTNEEISEVFKDIDNGSTAFIKRTLEKDPSKDLDSANIELFKRIRQGELATVDNAKDLLGVMFKPERYDISSVGRYKLTQRLPNLVKNSKKEGSRVLEKEDLIEIISEIIRLNNNPQAIPDDIDNLGNRRIRSVGEMLQQRLRVGLSRMERTIKDRMSTLDAETLTPIQLINSRPFSALIKEFFMTNQLSQFMDQINILSELEHRRRVSALGPGGLTRERAGFEVRDVHPSYYGRLCPITTPEGPNIGLINYLAGYTKINKFGILETPYRKLEKGKITKQIDYLTSFEEVRHKIAHAGISLDKDGNILDAEVEGRANGQPSLISRDEIDYIDVSPQQAFSIATSLIPFLEHDDATRAMMGSNMQRQAVPCVSPQAPLVGTGVEELAARDSGRLLMAETDGIVTKVDAGSISVKYGSKEKSTI